MRHVTCTMSRSTITGSRRGVRTARRERLTLALGCRVLLTADLTDTLVNGTFGTVEAFRFAGLPSLVPSQLQGAAAQDAETLLPRGMTQTHVQNVWPQIHLLRNWPTVAFSNAGSRVVVPAAFEVQDVNNGQLLAGRMQVPLLLAYALTVHKSQGMTLERCEVDTYGCWDFGMLYTACSRVRDRASVALLGEAGQRPDRLSVSRRLRLAHLDVLKWVGEQQWDVVTW